ncbi:hypothetical protein Ancab_025388 [Ancistrocladus abbreviatus]
MPISLIHHDGRHQAIGKVVGRYKTLVLHKGLINGSIQVKVNGHILPIKVMEEMGGGYAWSENDRQSITLVVEGASEATMEGESMEECSLLKSGKLVIRGERCLSMRKISKVVIGFKSGFGPASVGIGLLDNHGLDPQSKHGEVPD